MQSIKEKVIKDSNKIGSGFVWTFPVVLKKMIIMKIMCLLLPTKLYQYAEYSYGN